MTNEISLEKENAAIDMIAAMVAEELADELNTTPEEILPAFLQSGTCKLLYDRESKLWWDGPSEIADMYLKERNNKAAS
ncbi:MAG: hypothetical protein IKS55_07705 [Oscillospiraceae bacterium]|nr:hypothetical protein [Oscillospiraceae bacterium]